MTAHADAGAKLVQRHLSAGVPAQLDDTLRLFVRATIDNHRDNPRLHRVLYEEAPRAPAFLEHLHDMERSIVDATLLLLDQHPDIQAN
jgi:Tetracyclin repressor-like, C-terminal domain